MKKGLAALDLMYLVKELGVLVSSKVVKVYQPAKKEILFQLHLPSVGKKILRFMLPNFVYLSEFKEDQPEQPKQYSMLLRKHLENARIRKIQQKDFERILEIVFETKEKKYILIAELFSKGNLILCDEDYKIIAPLERQEWKQRTIAKGIVYKFPEHDKNPLELSLNEFAEKIKSSNKESLVKTLAIDFTLGGVYAEELCLLANIDKNKKEITDSEIKKLHSNISKIKSKTKANLVFEKDALLDITPFKLKHYNKLKQKEFKTFNEALDYCITNQLIKQQEEKKTEKTSTEIKKLNIILETQKQTIEKLQSQIKENKEKADMIYKKYPEIAQILNAMKELRKKHSWKDIKQQLKKKNNKNISEINEKDSSFTVDF